jgi:hypothetical protein
VYGTFPEARKRKKGNGMINLFGHSITGPAFILVYLALVAALVITYWLSQKLNERGQKAVHARAGDSAVRKKTDRLQKKRPVLRPVRQANEVIHGRDRAAYRRPNWPRELDKKLSPTYVLDPVTRSVGRKRFVSSKETREAWLKNYEMNNRRNNRATGGIEGSRESQNKTAAVSGA